MLGMAIRDILINNIPVNTLVAGRIRFLSIPQNAPLPYITYSILNEIPSDTLQGMAGLFTSTVQIDCYAKTYAESIDLSEKVRLSLQGYSGINKNVEIQGVYYVNGTDSFEAEIINYRRILRFDIWYKKPNPIFS